MNNSDLTYIEKRSIRPWVLGFCFFWGLVLGFVAYVNSETFAERQKKRDEQEQQMLAAKEKLKPVQKVVQKKEDIPEFKQAPINNDTKIIEPNIPEAPIIPEDEPVGGLKEIPEPPRLAFTYAWGLNGMTTYRPVQPVKIPRKAPEVDFKPRPSRVETGPVNLEDIDGPEIEE